MAARQSVFPGLAILATIAVLASLVATVIPYLNGLILAIALGVLIANVGTVPSWARPGVQKYTVLLETAIVLLGARIALDQLAVVGPSVLVLVVCVVTFGVLFVELLSRIVFTLPRANASLLAAGSSICGVSAVVAVGSSIRANEEQIAYVAGTVLLFDALTLLVFPLVGSVLALPPQLFGVWVGLSMFSTGPVAAVGFTHSEVAGEWATITKLARNSFIGFLAIGYATIYLRKRSADSGIDPWQLWTTFPKFLVGFLLVVLITNAGVLPAASIESISLIADWLFLLAFAGLGFDIRLSAMRDTGVRPVCVVLVYLLVVSSLTLVAVTAML